MRKAQEDIDKFYYSILPLKQKNKLGAVLLQFPVFFYPGNDAKDYILKCKEKFQDVPLVIEFRNGSWAKPETFEFLKNNNIAYCMVDEPKLPRLMPFINEVTSDIGYLRLHGRNKNWFNAPLNQRYDYLYSDKELEEFLPEIDKIVKHSKTAYLFLNNCHAGSAVKNARKLKEMLGIPVLKSDKLF